jgi:RNA polymerase primary sigma factor
MTRALACEAAPKPSGRPREGDPPRPPLTDAERAARNELALANLPLVPYWAKRFTRRLGRKVDFDDLVQEGRIGLLRAAELYDPSRGVAFSTYASHWIKQRMGRAFDKGDLVRVPDHQWAWMGLWKETARSLRAAFGRPADDDEIAAALGWGADRVATVRAAFQAARAPKRKFAGTRAGPSRIAEDREEIEALRRAIAQLTPRRRAVIEMVLEGVERPDIARRLGISKQAVYEYETFGRRDLRERLTGVFLNRGPGQRRKRKGRDATALATGAAP